MGIIIWISYAVLCFPIAIFGKRVFSSLTNMSFIFTGSNMVDLVILFLVIVTMCITSIYDNSELRKPLFSETENNLKHVKFMGNMI